MIPRRPLRRKPARRSLLGNAFRQLRHEALERRELLAAEVLAIRPDSAGLLQDGDVLNVAPRELNLFFNGGANLDESTINASTVRLLRSGGDGSFDGNDVEVALGYVGLVNPGSSDPGDLQQVVIRPASTAAHNATDPAVGLPDDLYQIQIIGAGSAPLADLSGRPFRDGDNAVINFRLDRGAQVVAVVPQPVSRDALGNLQQADNQIVVYFDDQTLNRTDAENPAFFRLVDTGATLTADDDQTLLPQTAQYDAAANQVTLTFDTAIPEGTYRLDIGRSDGGIATQSAALRVGTLFDQNAFRHNGYLGDQGNSHQDPTDRDFYRLELAAGSQLSLVVTPHRQSLNLRARLLDSNGNQVAAVDSGAGTAGTLNFSVPASAPYFIEVSSADPADPQSTGSYGIVAQVSGHAVSTSDANTTFDTATPLGSLGAAGLTLAGQIEPQHIPLPPRAGGVDEPGHRQIQRETHIGASGTTASLPAPITRVNYHFPPAFANPSAPGESFLNQITAEERRIVRAIFEIFASQSGYEFVETATAGLRIGKTDLRAFDPDIGPNAGVGGLGGPGGAIVNAALYQDANRYFGDGFTEVMFHEIGHALGLGHSYELSALMGEGTPNDVVPGDHDIAHLQRISPPNSTDIDLYRFELAEAGRLSAETIAERLSTPSLLNTVLTLYRQTASGDRELVARNDRYFGTDSFIELDLQPGAYFIGVSSTGNDQYDPNVPDSGYGGTTDGPYELRLRFEADRGAVLRDADGTAIDGDGDGVPGGVHQFWFQASDVDSTLFVDRANDPLLGGSGGDGSLAAPFDRLNVALAAAGSRIVVPRDAVQAIHGGESFVIDDGTTELRFNFGAGAGQPIDLAGLTTAEQIAAAIAAAINASSLSATATVQGRVVQLAGIDNLDVSDSPALLHAPNLVRIVGNAGADGDLATAADNLPYLLGSDSSGNPLRDGNEFLVPQGVTVMLEAGALIKARRANLDAGTSAVNLSRAAAAIQVLGTPLAPVWMRSYHDDTIGGNSDGVGPGPQRGDFGGIVFRGDSDLESAGVFLNHVTHLDIQHGGGQVFVNSSELVFAPIHLEDARPTVRFNHIARNADSAISANPDSFDDSLGRIGPQIVGNFLNENTIDGLFIRIRTQQGAALDKLNLPGRFDDNDITHVLSENLLIAGNPGGPLQTPSGLVARAAGRLMIDPGVVLKINGARIEAERGSSALIAEGTPNRPIIFTSLADDRYGGSGAFDSNADGFSVGAPGDWAGLYFGQVSSGRIDNAVISFGGGNSPIEGGSANFNAIEVHQADLRITGSLIRDNASGAAGGAMRHGRGANTAAAIYGRGSQPVIVDNTFIDNAGPVLSLDVNSLHHRLRPDGGRATGPIDVHAQFADNHGPLVRLNSLAGNDINGMMIRGGELTTQGVWDDTDIVHVLQSEVVVGNHHTASGLRLQSSNSESLVIKLAGSSAGFTATGTPLDIVDRIGGTVHVLGRPGFPVVLTHLADDSVGAGFAPDGTPMTNTNNSAAPTTGATGGWRGLRFDNWSNDRNVAIVRESENPLTSGKDLNRTPAAAQFIGELAPDEKSGDENRRLGFEIHGFISPDDPGDVDVYSFRGTAGTPIWIDVDRTDPTLDAIVEVLNAAGTVVARSVRSGQLSHADNLNVQDLTQNPLLGGDYFTHNFRDPGMHYVLPGVAGSTGTYFLRVRSNPQTGQVTDLAGKSSGKYQLQLRLQQVDEFPGSTVRYADIRYASTAIDVHGLPSRSPLVGEAGELAASNDTLTTAQPLANLLQTDMAAISISGALSSATDVDWYRFNVEHEGIQEIGGVNDDPGTVAVVFDLDYADGAVRGDTTVAVYDAGGRLIWIGRESNIEDDRPLDPSGNVDDLSRGSIGSKDPYIGPIHVRPGGMYHVAVMSNQQLPTALMGAYSAAAGNNAAVRLEPINTVRRVVEDHIGFVGHTSLGAPVQPESGPIIDLTNLDDHVVPFQLEDVVLYVATDNAATATGDHLYTVNPFRGERYLTRVTEGAEFTSGANDIQDIVIRSDGRMFGYQRLAGVTGSVGALVEINPSTGTVTVVGNDNIPGRSPTPNTRNLNTNLGTHLERAEQFTTSDEVDALTFARRGATNSSTAPAPIYDTYYVVRESESDSTAVTNSKLYRGRANGDATPAAATVSTPRYGVIGDIQPAGVTFASTNLTVSNNATTPQSTVIRIEAKRPGTAGNSININVTRPSNTNAVVSVFNNTINLQIGGTGGPPLTAAPTAQAIVDAINNHEDARELVTAVIVGGNDGGNGTNGTVALNVSGGGLLSGGSNGDGPLAGRVTGISYGNFTSSGNLFGVTTAGEFISINPNTAVATVLNQVANVNFQGLTLGPQNVQGGAFANTLFATANDGRLYAFDTSGNQLPIFAGGASSIAVGSLTGNAIGLAFSPLDFNLWHPTMKRGGDPGHGVNAAPDASRAPTRHEHDVATAAGDQVRQVNEGQGGVSMHFGFERWSQSQNNNPQVYLPTSSVNAQHGIRDARQHQDLSTNSAIGETYNFPGGALGSLQTNGFSLADSVPQDRPTLYFNYFLETENHGGSSHASDGADPFRDSARVFASRNGGATWELLATNNSRLSGNDPTNGDQRAELPGFLSHLSDAALNSSTPRSQSHQIVQELMDNSGQWRQARVDLSSFAGVNNVLLRFDFSTAGAMRDSTLGIVESSFGEFTSGGTPRSIRSTNNAFEGFYIDDIIVGYAERGEMVTGAPVDSTITSLAAGRTRDNDSNRRPNILSGEYQLEIRRTDDVGTWVEGAGTAITQTFHTNDRHLNEVAVTSSLGFEVGESFSTSLPSASALREVLAALGFSVPPGALIDSLLPGAFATWSATDIDPLSGARSLASPATFPSLSSTIGELLPGEPSQRLAAIYQTTPAQLGAQAGRGLLRFQYSVSSAEDLHGLMLLIDGVPQFLTPPMSSETGYGGANVLASGERRNIMVELPFDDANSTLTWMYLFADQQGLASGDNRAWIDDIVVLQGNGATGYEADRNRHRPQGMFIVESNTITDSAVRGINVQPAAAEAGGGVPHPGSTINFPQLNDQRLVPGVVIQNNIIAGSSAIRFAGETTASPQRPVPFGRIVNNTLVGGGAGVGLQIDGFASPTVMNNIITEFTTGIGGSTALAEVESNYFQANGSHGTTGASAIVRAAGTPLFVDAAAGNYYLVSGSMAVDSSRNTLEDRFDYGNFKTELGIPRSPIFAPDRDVLGQLRVDSGQSPGGGGSAVFKDRGAVDRADGDAPFAVLLDPIDNDITGIDQDPNLSIVSLLDPIASAFSILLTDGPGPNAPFQGTGVDPLTVSRDVVTVRRNNQELVEGIDYTLGYNTATGEMRLTPLSTLWEPSGVYEIILDNQQITDRAGNPLRPNQPDGTTRFWIVLPSVGFDFGDAPASFATALEANGPRHALIDGALPRLGRAVDAEADRPIPPATDDLAAEIFTTVALPAGESVFAVSGDATPAVAIQLLSAAPAAGDRITINTASGLHTFELVPVGVAAAAGNVAVRFVDGDTPESLAEKLRVSLLARLGSPGDALSVTIDATAPDTVLLTHHDDEDGVGVTRLLGDDYLVFVRPGDASHPQYADAISDNAEVLGFLNPLDPAGAQVALTVTGSGFIDGWIDFDGNGVFDPESEKVFDSIAVNDGLNILNIATPAGTADGQRWMRVRLSPEGGLQPTGLAVGGEVEDHLVEIIGVDLPIPSDDRYTLFEDTVIDSLGDGQAAVVDNDSLATRTFTPFEIVVVDGPEFAADFSLDPATGHFVYEPLSDFAGIDTFTYYVAIQQSAVDADITLTQPLIATVTLDVRPVNDAPLAAPQSFITLESQPVAQPGDPPQVGRSTHPLTISAADLLADARAHADPQYPAGAPAAPWDETDQSLRVVEIVLPDGTVIDAAGASDAGEAVVFNTVHGTLTARFVTTDDPDAPFVSSLGALVDLIYLPHDYLNRDNVTLQSVEYRGEQVDVFDFIRFTIEDDGLLIDPATVDPDTHEIVEDDTFFTAPFNPLDPTNPLGRLRHQAIALLDVAPQNDYPLPADDRITVGALGAGLPTPAGDTTPIDPASAWSQYFAGLGLEVPVPTEDQTLVIPAGFLLQNDFVGQAISTDENGGTNDGDLQIIAATLLTQPASGGGSVSVNGDGDVVFVAPTDVYGEVVFSYVIQDSGIDEDRDGNRPVAPLTATGTVTIVVQPANDAPQAFDRQLTFAEAGDPGVDVFEFDADQLLDRLHVSTPAVPGSLTPDLQPPFTEAEQGLRVVAFATDQGAVDVAQLDDYTGPGTGNGMLVLPSDDGGYFEFDIEDGALTTARFFAAADYSERTPFAAVERLRFTIEDDGRTTDPQSGAVIELPAVRSTTAATLTITVGESNDAPIFTLPTAGLVIDENGGQAVVQSNFATGVAPGPLTALDELQRQDVAFSITPVNVPEGLMMVDEDGVPLLPSIDVTTGGPDNWTDSAGNGIGAAALTVYPAADAFGFAVYQVTATDNDPDNPRSTSRLLTITINPVNDVPVAYDRALNVDEAVEVDGEVALISFDAARLIQGASETPSVPGLFPIELIDPYNETEQALRVVAFGVPGAADVDVTIDEPGLTGGTGTVTRTTVTGGTLTFEFVDGAFVSGSYAPAIDYNERTPFDAADLFTYILSDNGQTTLPGSGFVNYDGSSTDSTITIPEQRSAAAAVTLTVTQQNDPPIFTMPDGFTFDENNGQAVVSVDFVTMIAPSELTALDELQRQDVSFSFEAVSVPAGMMTQLPTIDVDGEAGDWPGTGILTVYPAADAFGFAVYLVTATDNDPDNPRSTSRLLTITINPVNDVPVAYDRALNVDEAVEVDGEVALISFDAARLIQGVSETPSVPGLFPIELIDPYNETEQALRVVAFGVPGAADVDVTIDEPGLTGGTGTVTRTTVTGGTLTFEFVDGAFVSGSYAPAIDYNERTPFDAADLFTYILSDDGQTTLPGSGYVGYDGSSTDSTITIPEQRSAPATVTLTVTQQNDPPIFTMPDGFTFDENNGQAVVSVDFVTMLAPSELTALDELQRQDVSFSFEAVSVPVGMMTQLPTIDVDGEAGDWPGTGTLTVYPAADAFGFAVYQVTATDNDPDNPRSTSQLLTITINPVNDVPVAYSRELVVAEAVERDGEVAVRNFTRDELLGVGGAMPNAAGLFPADLMAPYNESEQRLRIVRFEIPGQAPIDAAIDEPGLVGGTGTVTRITRTNENGAATATSGVLTFEFAGGEFISGSYTPAVDYNERTPFEALDPFTYFIADDGQTTLPGSGFIDYDGTGSGTDATIHLAPLRSAAATVALRVTQVNDPPRFDFHSVVNVLERDDNQPAVVAGWATNIAPAASTALDELARQSVSFQFVPELSSVPAGLFQSPPVVTPEGTLSVFPMRDAVGTAVVVMRAVDHEPTAGFQSRSTDATFTVNVRPVNDRPAFNPSRFNTSDSVDADTGWQVLANGTIRYTLRENNAQPDGDTSTDFFIPLRQLDSIDVYDPIGMLDIFRVGPANEADGTPGGLQTLDLASFPSTTALGGLLTPAIVNGQAGLYYRPPVNANLANSGLDSFTFTATDDGQTYVLGSSPFVDGALVDAPLTINGRVELRLNPVNNPPEFTLPTPYVEAAEDSSLVVHPGFATEITPGPADAPDEASQSVNFIINPLNFTRGGGDDPFGAGYPQINSSGRLTFRPLPNVFGSFEFEVTLVDSGPGAAEGRGDNNRSIPQTITIQIQPVNDPPVQVAQPVPLSYELLEDQSIDLPLAGIPGLVGLLDNFRVGPANEAADSAPLPGGNQSLWLPAPPSETLQNGQLTPLFDLDGNLTHLRYTPRAHFVGIDTFSFTVSDDGVSVAVGAAGQPHADPRSTTGTVTLNVLPVNDAPLFSGGGDVQVDEDAGLVTLTGWATGLQAGPSGAADELQGLITGLPAITPQTMQFIITRVEDEGASLFEPLFTIDPTATISGSTATLSFQTAPDANGVAVFEVVLRDDGPDNPARGDVNASVPIRLTITVGAVNDPPQFAPGADVQVTENSGPYSQPWASDILPGTPTAIDELAEQTAHFQVEHTVVSPVGFTNMFAPGGAPAIDADGVLTFTPAENAAGEVLVRVTLIDSEGDPSETRLFTILITDTNQPPVAADLALEGDEDNLLEIPGADLLALASDPDLQTNPQESLSITDVAPLSAAGAAISIGPGGELLYDPRGSAILQALAPGELFVDHFTYRVVDAAAAQSNLATITINVAGINDAPLVSPETVTAAPGQSTVISPLDNDVDVDGNLDPTSIFITRQPSSGSLTVRPDGTLLYTPQPNFRGQDLIRYTVADNLGQQSEQTTITINVVGSPLENPEVYGDVNADGQTQALDALLVINRLALGQRQGYMGSIPVDAILDEQPRRYYDVDGNGRVEPLDALRVLIQMAQDIRNPAAGQGEGESESENPLLAAAPPIVAASFVDLAGTPAVQTAPLAATDPGSLETTGREAAALFEQADDEEDAYTLLAADWIESRSEKPQRAAQLELIDAVWESFE